MMEQQRSGKIPTAVRRYGISRSALYKLAEKHAGLFKKRGRTTLVDFTVGDEIIDKLPNARLAEAEERKSA